MGENPLAETCTHVLPLRLRQAATVLLAYFIWLFFYSVLCEQQRTHIWIIRNNNNHNRMFFAVIRFKIEICVGKFSSSFHRRQRHTATWVFARILTTFYDYLFIVDSVPMGYKWTCRIDASVNSYYTSSSLQTFCDHRRRLFHIYIRRWARKEEKSKKKNDWVNSHDAAADFQRTQTFTNHAREQSKRTILIQRKKLIERLMPFIILLYS